MQVLLNMLRGYTPQAALDAPRFCISAGFEGKAADHVNSKVFFEDGIPEETIWKLRSQYPSLIKLLIVAL